MGTRFYCSMSPPISRLWAKTEMGITLGVSNLETKMNPERLANKTCDDLINLVARGICVDDYMQDQVRIFCSGQCGKLGSYFRTSSSAI